MAFDLRFKNTPSIAALVLTVLLIFSFSPKTSAFPEVIITVGDTTGMPNELNSVISIYMDNFIDTIAGFNLWIQLDRPDLILFQTNLDTVINITYWICNDSSGTDCIDSTLTNPLDDWDFSHTDTTEVFVGSHDVTGTLIENWEYVDSRSLSGFGGDINIAAFSNLPEPPETPGIAPQQGGLLIKVLADILDISDTELERTVNLLIQHDTEDKFNMSRTDGTSIGISYEQIIDTSCFVCDIWCGPECCSYQKVSFPPGGDYENCDSLYIVPDSSPYVDTSIVLIIDGSLTVEIPPDFICGDVNGDFSNLSDISDLTYLVAYVFKGGAAPDPLEAADMQCSGTTVPVDIADVTYLVTYLFKGGPAPCATCP